MAQVNRIADPNKGDPMHKKADKTSSVVEAPFSAAAKIAAASVDPRIDVRVYLSKSGQKAPVGEHFALARFYSHVKPNFAVECPLLLARKSMKDLDFEMGVMCGAMAERLGELYGDNFDPDKAAREGSNQLVRVLQEWERSK